MKFKSDSLFKALFLGAIIILISCKSMETNPDNYKQKIMVFGNGGGFAGIEKSYYLLDNGQVFLKTNRDTSYTKVGKLESKLTGQLFTLVGTLQKDSVVNDPGNIYSFLKPDKNGDEKWVWNPQSGVPQNLKIIYDILSKKTNNISNISK